MNNSIKDIFFDLDDTLWDFQKNSALTFQQIFLEHQLDVPLKLFLEKYRPINEKYWKAYRNEQINQETLRFGRLKDTFDEIKFEIKTEQISKIAGDYQLYLSENKALMPTAIVTLTYLQQNYNLHVLTNGFKSIQLKKLKNASIDHFFKTLTTPEDVNVKKPHADIFLKALEKAQTTKEKSLMIGDNFEVDILGAKNMGWQTIYFNPLAQKNITERTIKSLDQLIKIF